MIITVDPSQSEDIAAFAMVKQYRMQALNVTLNGGTGVSAWQAVQGGEGYTQTVVTPVTGIELVYEDPNAIVSYTVENDDTSNYDVASNAGIILSSIEPTTNAWTYTCVFHADSVPVSAVDIDLLVYGNIARGTEQQGSPATAEEITAQVLSGLETRVLALENEMPDKADKSDTYTKTEIDNSVVKLTGDQVLSNGVKANTTSGSSSAAATLDVPPRFVVQSTGLDRTASQGINRHYPVAGLNDRNGKPVAKLNVATTDVDFQVYLQGIGKDEGQGTLMLAKFDRTAKTWAPTIANDALDAYLPMVRIANNQDIDGIKTFNGRINAGAIGASQNITSAYGTTRKWRHVATISNLTGSKAVLLRVQTGLNNSSFGYGTFWIYRNGSANVVYCKKINYYGSAASNLVDMAISYDTDNTVIKIWIYRPAYNTVQIFKEAVFDTGSITNNSSVSIVASGNSTDYDTPTDTNVISQEGMVETLEGAKTFTNTPKVQSPFPEIDLINTNLDRDATPDSTLYALTFIRDKNANEVASYGVRKTTDGYQEIYFYQKLGTNRNAILNFRLTSSAAYVTAPNRGYDSNNASTYANDVVTFTSLGAYTPMVRTTGDQTIAGTKTFIGPGQSAMELSNYPIWQMRETAVGFDETGITASGMNFYRKGEYSGRIAETTEADGSTTIDFMIKSNVSSPAREGRLQIYEKLDHTFGMRFWNGTAWTNIVS